MLLYEDYGKNNKCESPRPVGRPALAADDKRKSRHIKMTDEEWRKIQEKAKAAGISTSEYIRLKAGD